MQRQAGSRNAQYVDATDRIEVLREKALYTIVDSAASISDHGGSPRRIRTGNLPWDRTVLEVEIGLE